MSQRERRRKDQRRTEAQRRGPSKRQIAAGATIAMGATLAATGSAQAATFTVSNLNDNGAGSLRQALLDSNFNGISPDSITFASGLSGTIDVGSFNGQGLYAETPVNIQGPGADKLTLRGVNGVGYVVFTGRYSTGYAGEPITISGLTITGGTATSSNFSADGGGIFNNGANLTVSKSVITGNHADENGGGIYSKIGTGSNLTVIDSTISGNTAEPTNNGYGGGIFAGSPATIQGSAVFDNNARDGGGVYSRGSGADPNSLTIQRSTIARNRAVNDDGGGVWFCCGDGGEKLTIQSSTISGNSTLNTAGGVEVYLDSGSARPEIDNTIISGNTSTNDAQYGDVYFEDGASVAFSLIGNPPAAQINQTGPNLFGVNPQLGPLQSNGGPTPSEALAATSPAIDKGKAFGLTSDQRGVVRPIDFPAIPNAAGGDGSDIGAFELQPDNRIKLGKLKRNKQSGTGKQVVKVPQPAAGTLTIKGKGLKTKSLKIGKKTKKKVKLPVIPKGSKRAQENATGSVKLRAKVIYKPVGNASKTLKRKLKLLKS